MPANDTDSIRILNGLIAVCKDGEKGFLAAGERMQDRGLQELFLMYAQQRARFVDELQVAVRRLGGEPGRRGSITGVLHRGWMSVKSAVNAQSDEALIAEAERGEDVARAAYQKAVEAGLPLDVQAVVERQMIQVKEAHDRMRTLERKLELADKPV